MDAACERTARLLACGATPELLHVQAELGARLSFREAARILDTFLPAYRPHNHRSAIVLQRSRIGTWDNACPHHMGPSGAAALSVFIDGAYIVSVGPGRSAAVGVGRIVSALESGHYGVLCGAAGEAALV
jgi:hypothetical protein